MNIRVLIYFLICSKCSFGQDNLFAPLNEIHANWTKTYSKGDYKCDTFFYSDKIDIYTLEYVENILLENNVFLKYSANQDTTNAERITLDSKEIEIIINELKLFHSSLWPDKLFPTSRVVPIEMVDSIQKSVNDKKLNPLIRLCSTVHFFSKPIYFRDNTFCMFYSGNTNFAVKEGEFWIFKREKTKWIKYSPI